MSEILLIIPYKFYPPTNGGSLRCFTYSVKWQEKMKCMY